MKKIIIILTLAITLTSCSSEPEFIPIEKITDSNKNYTIGDFKEIKFKQSVEYDIKDLPGVISAYYGFIKNNLGKPKDYEIRFYSSHEDAVNVGVKYADNITGKEGCIKKDCSLWTKNLKHRQQVSEPFTGKSAAGNGIPIPKYQTYIIHGNFVLLCSGYNEEEALKACTIIIEDLDAKSSS